LESRGEPNQQPMTDALFYLVILATLAGTTYEAVELLADLLGL